MLKTDSRAIHPAAIHPHVRFICHRLAEEGHEAFVVGGAVRDLLVGRTPKDYDVVTSARPAVVMRLFRNARTVGRRFRLVLLTFPDMVVEVSTFRGEPRKKTNGQIKRDNTFGTPEEDAKRRDFTINALSYDPETGRVLDYIDGMRDLERRVIRTIKPPRESILEDPVRMLRAVRFKVRLDFRLDAALERAIPRMAHELRSVIRHRLAEETQRFLTRGNAQPMWAEFARVGLVKHLLAADGAPWFFSEEAEERPVDLMQPYLARMDAWVAEGGEPVPPTVALLGLLLTLARPELRAALLSDAPAPAARKGRRSVDPLERLPVFLSEWGLLNGQVEPALDILAAARRLLEQAGVTLAPETGCAAPARPKGRSRGSATAGKRRKGAHHHEDAPLGTREAWLLLAILQDVLGLDTDFVAEGVAQIPGLPDLPILDHPRPRNRPQRVTPRNGAEGETDPWAEAAESAPRRRRKPRQATS